MPSYVTPKKNTEFIFYISLVSQADTKLMQVNPTLAAADFNVATDDGAPGALNTTPVIDADFTRRVKVTLSASEMNGDNVTFIASDVAGAEWCDLTINLQTTAGQIDDIPTTTEFEARSLPSADYVVVGDTIAGVTLVDTTTDVSNDVGITQAGADKAWGTAVRILTANTNFNDPTAATIRDAILDDATRFSGANIDASISSRGTAEPGDLMGLANDAITSAKYDESTAYPIKSADTGATQIARTGADSDTLETVSDQIDGITAAAISDAVWDEAIAGHLGAGSTGSKLNIASSAAGAGAITWVYTVTDADTGAPIDGVSVWVTTDSAGANVIASGTTDDSGEVTFYLDAGLRYIWRSRSGYNFSNPDQETIA